MTKEILITGATGFIGANVARHALERGDSVHVFMRSSGHNWRIKEIMPRLKMHKVDLRNTSEIRKAVGKIRPHHVYHLASYGAYPFQSQIGEMIRTDVSGTVALLQALRDVNRLEAVISAGSSTEYGFKTKPMKEDDTLEPTTAYGAAKASQTLWSQFYAKAYGLPVMVMRPSLVYGPYEEPTRLIPETIMAHIRKSPLKLSSPFPKKDFVYIEDVLRAFDVFAKHAGKHAGGIFNVASGTEYSVGEVVMLVRRLMDCTIPFQWGGREGRIWDTDVCWVDDISRAKRVLAWQPRHTFEQGLTKTIGWYQKNQRLYS